MYRFKEVTCFVKHVGGLYAEKRLNGSVFQFVVAAIAHSGGNMEGCCKGRSFFDEVLQPEIAVDAHLVMGAQFRRGCITTKGTRQNV